MLGQACKIWPTLSILYFCVHIKLLLSILFFLGFVTEKGCFSAFENSFSLGNYITMHRTILCCNWLKLTLFYVHNYYIVLCHIE